MTKIFFVRVVLCCIIIYTGALCYGQVPAAPPNPYQSDIKINYIRTWDATAPEINPNTLMTRPLADVKMATQYIDGLGRPSSYQARLVRDRWYCR
jgi:hypothetical protein